MRRRIGFVIAIATLGGVQASTSTAQTDGYKESPTLRVEPPREQMLEIAEDVEILATILQENLQAKYPRNYIKRITGLPTDPYSAWPGVNTWTGANASDRQATIQKPLGTHLPGYGVVFLANVPAPQEKTSGASQRPKSESRWDRARRALSEGQLFAHGMQMSQKACQECHSFSTKPVPPPKERGLAPPVQTSPNLNLFPTDPAPPANTPFGPAQPAADPPAGVSGENKPPTPNEAWKQAVYEWTANPNVTVNFSGRAGPTLEAVVESVVDALGENGHHLRHIADDEKVCVVLSYRDVDGKPAMLPGAGAYRGARVRVMRAPVPSRVLITAAKKSLDRVVDSGDREEFRKRVSVQHIAP